MGTPLEDAGSSASLADALFPRTRQRVLGLIFGQPDRAYAITDLIRLAGAGSGAVQREVDRLVSSGLVTVTTSGPHRRYQANHEAPIFEELRAIVEKTSGVPGVLQAALEPLRSRIACAVLYGSVAKGTDTALSDIDVLVVADELTLEELFRALAAAEQRLGRRINPVLYSRQELRERTRAGHPFVTKVLSGKHVVLMGDPGGAAEAG